MLRPYKYNTMDFLLQSSLDEISISITINISLKKKSAERPLALRF
jgi:hypothetical protein